jgi:polyisoprenoid-binding protein YceI
MIKTFLATMLLITTPFGAYAADVYNLDSTHSYVLWHIDHFGFSNPSGKWMAEGKLSIDIANPEKSTANITIHVGNIVTGIPALDEHLRTADFFDTKQYPTATFTSTKVIVTNKHSAHLVGNLTVHGMTKSITLDVIMNKQGMHPITHKDSLGFTATAMLKRSDFGMKTYLPGLGDTIELEIEVEASK